MKNLWAPWRIDYVQRVDDQGDECIFCSLPEHEEDKSNLILCRGAENFVVLNRYPYNNGHLMVVPYRHVSDSGALPDPTWKELWRLTNRCKDALANAFRPDGFNIGMNIGRVAGAGIDQHVHMHIVPRWNGDTNFMPVIANAKVISQGLEQTYDALASYFGG